MPEVEIAEDHPIRDSDWYGAGNRWLRRWALSEEGMPICAYNALDTSAASPSEVEAAESANNAVRESLGIPVPPGPALALTDYETAIQAHIDASARSRGYADGNSCASYALSTNTTWAAEAAAFIAWRDAVWVEVHTLFQAVQGGAAAPTVRSLIAGLPPLVWPV